ncbi:T9SS type A sorting domain-containing protein [Flavobacterium psychrotrophum]|uniref:T9SS type A sorting domain-containing protein n=1 Tax=Flavobacterium psychrotrophum TaxID=2294119 RepID=UPI000E314C6F|nr:T9SS type A sorting domain-containing protein [Flavobacterium psychrotrophum]
MIKKLLMLCTVFMAGTAMMFAQFPSIGIIGGATSVGWDGPDIDMATTDGVTYTLENVTLTGGGLKFRQDNAWNGLNWGNNAAWPSGVGLQDQNGQDIQCQPGKYDITFNLTTKAYNFEDVGGFEHISLIGGGTNINLVTTDGVNYFYNNAVFTAQTNVAFTNGNANWGAVGFPTGTAAEGVEIPVPANSYNVTFNLTTHEYHFNFVTISITGSGVGGWGTDSDMTTTDGVNYSYASRVFAVDGEGLSEMKFRLNHEWTVTWGGAQYPSGTMTQGGGNVTVPVGTYAVTFNRTTGAFDFSAPAAVTTYTKGSVVAYPNPANASWTFSTANGTLTNIQIVDLTGKIVASQVANAQQATVNASALANGVYFAKVNSAEGTSVIKVVKN